MTIQHQHKTRQHKTRLDEIKQAKTRKHTNTKQDNKTQPPRQKKIGRDEATATTSGNATIFQSSPTTD